ncbi:MAG: glycosyltransferase family 2 protein [Treponema sp.]|jgi:glycosyltransferase involved in cell wall biosynthesis|nr:glycosyltransferase family 2 protein [Treponema sp.]
MKQGFLIPVYNGHGKTAGLMVKKLSRHNLPIIIVDDGSDRETKESLSAIVADCPLTMRVTLAKNKGKGGALSAGIDKAHELGLTRVLQLDADEQHDIERTGFFLEQSRLHPESMICSYPEYDDSVPAIRKNGRKIANMWANIVTLSHDMTDVMCGFRVYPVEPVWRIIHRHHLDQRMGFETEILIRLHWNRIPLLFYPVRVTYPAGGVSHYRLVRDNIRITWMFIRLFFGMICRSPLIISRRIRRTPQRCGEGGVCEQREQH